MAKTQITKEIGFWAKVNKLGPVPSHRSELGPCWVWLAYTNERGYGNTGGVRVHRLAWILTHGPIPNNLHVLHRCDNRACVRPDHLMLGTHNDNMRDAAQKRRIPYGEGSFRSKLTELQVKEIRATAGLESQHAIAKRLGVSRSVVAQIRQRRSWRHVD